MQLRNIKPQNVHVQALLDFSGLPNPKIGKIL
jgi:hypothetical protein